MKKHSNLHFVFFLGLINFIIFVFSLLVGSGSPNPLHMLAYLTSPLLDNMIQTPGEEFGSFLIYRTTRAVLGLTIGFSLGLVGASLQGIFRNPLAAPSTLGVTSASALGIAVALFLPTLIPISQNISVHLFSFSFAIMSMAFIVFLAKMENRLDINTLLLAGVTVSLFCGGAIMFIQNSLPPEDHKKVFNALMSNLYFLESPGVQAPLVITCLLCCTYLLYLSYSLNPIALGNDYAMSVGVNPNKIYGGVFITSSLLVSLTVAKAGPISFVGLMAPHMVRRYINSDHRYISFCSGLAGAALLLSCECIGSLLEFRGGTTPASIVTSLLGAPFFLWILVQSRRKYSTKVM